MKYWLNLDGDRYELNTVDDNDTVAEGKLSDLGIGENDPMWQDKLDRHFKEIYDIEPTQWEVG